MERVEEVAGLAEAAESDSEATVDVGRERFANASTAALGLVLGVVGLLQILRLAHATGSNLRVFGCAVYGGSLVTLYAASTLYHAVREGRLRTAFRLFDHTSIYLLIAGSYTPFTLIWLAGRDAWFLFVTVWACAAFGIGFKLAFRYRYETLSTVFYVLMGWVGVVAIKPLIEVAPIEGLLWTVAGGVLYTVGTIFYVLDDTPYFHAVWHLFVLGGSACHYAAIAFWVVPFGV